MSSAGILKKPPLKIDEITLLDPDGRYLNDFITDMQHRALLEVGDIAEFIKTGVYPHPLPVVILPNKFDAFGNDADTKQTAVLQSEVDKQYARLIFDLQQQRRKMLQFILTHISDESKSKLEREENYETHYAASDPLAMWKLLLQLHRPGYSSVSTEGQKSAANDSYFSLKMAIGQDIVNFRRDFIIARKVRVDCGNAYRTEKEAAWDFIHRLDTTQFGGFQQFINNQIAGGAIKEEVLTFDYVQKLINRFKAESNTPSYHAPQVAYTTEYEEMKEQLLLFSRKSDSVAPRPPNSPQSKKQISFSVVTPQRIDSNKTIKNANNKVVQSATKFFTQKLKGQSIHSKWIASIVGDGSMQEKHIFFLQY